MKLKIPAFAGATAIITAIAFSLCSLFLAVAPEATYEASSFLFHTNLTNLAYPMSWGTFFGGLAVWTIAMAITGAGLAWLYNQLIRE